MQKESANKLNPFYAFEMPLVRVVVFVLDRHMGLIHVHQSILGDGDAKDVTRQVSQDRLFAGSIGLGVGTPRLLPDFGWDLLEEIWVLLSQYGFKPSGNAA